MARSGNSVTVMSLKEQKGTLFEGKIQGAIINQEQRRSLEIREAGLAILAKNLNLNIN